jgi:hypothetical protein
MDAWLLKFIGDNWMTIYLALTMLKGIAIVTPWAADDKIITMLSAAYTAVRTGKIPDKIE